MQGIDATFDGVAFGFERTSAKLLPQFLGAAALALIGSVAVYLAHSRLAPPQQATIREPAPDPIASGARRQESAINPFGEIIIEPGWIRKKVDSTRLFPLPPLQTAPFAAARPASEPSKDLTPTAAPAPFEARLQPDDVPLPPVRDIARIDEAIPLPPPRPSGFGGPPERPSARDDMIATPGVPAAAPPPAGGPNLIQRLFGAESTTASTPPPTVARRIPSDVGPPSVAAPSPSVVSASQPQGRSGPSGVFAFFSPRPNLDRLGYDQYTAVYDISARTVYLPDGRKLEAHSGLGDRLDDPRYVSERMRGATPPHVYTLAMRESLFHGVQALRLNPVGEGDLYGRAGLLAHPYMLGPKGDSNGCVSVKDYATFLRAYEDGEIKRLAVVARL